jgi:hypothetical protein
MITKMEQIRILFIGQSDFDFGIRSLVEFYGPGNYKKYHHINTHYIITNGDTLDEKFCSAKRNYFSNNTELESFTRKTGKKVSLYFYPLSDFNFKLKKINKEFSKLNSILDYFHAVIIKKPESYFPNKVIYSMLNWYNTNVANCGNVYMINFSEIDDVVNPPMPDDIKREEEKPDLFYGIPISDIIAYNPTNELNMIKSSKIINKCESQYCYYHEKYYIKKDIISNIESKNNDLKAEIYDLKDKLARLESLKQLLASIV